MIVRSVVIDNLVRCGFVEGSETGAGQCVKLPPGASLTVVEAMPLTGGRSRNNRKREEEGDWL